MQGDRAEQSAKRTLKKSLGFARTGLGLHYGRHGIDVYGIRNTPHGRSLALIEVKSTRDGTKKGSEREVLKLLKPDTKGLQQGSRLYAENRLRNAVRRGSPVAKFIRAGQLLAGTGRFWQTRQYVHWVNVTSGEAKIYRAVSNKAGNSVSKLILTHHKSARKTN